MSTSDPAHEQNVTPAWPDTVDEILAGDHVVALAYATPAKGVVILPLSNFGVRDSLAATITVNSSVGVPKKLERIRQNPNVALAFHSRGHAAHDRPEYVLVQGRATLSEPLADYPSSMLEQWERFEPWANVSPIWKWWQRIYATRVGITVSVERILIWRDLFCSGEPRILGAPLLDAPPVSQRPPKNGTGPRVNPRQAASRGARLPHTLLGWIGAEDYPMVVPVSLGEVEPGGIALRATEGLLPPGNRRAGLTAHGFGRQVLSQHQRKHTGWLESDPAESKIIYSPHTDSSYRMPPSRLVYRLVTGAATRMGVPAARRAGLLPKSKREKRIRRAYQRHLANRAGRMLLTLGLMPRSYALLETRGWRTGQMRRVPVGNGLQKGTSTFWLISELGTRAGYVRNIQADNRVRVKIGRRWRGGSAHILTDDDARARQKRMSRLNSLAVRFFGDGEDLTTIRIDLDMEDS